MNINAFIFKKNIHEFKFRVKNKKKAVRYFSDSPFMLIFLIIQGLKKVTYANLQLPVLVVVVIG